jgi:hypothetical protein
VKVSGGQDLRGALLCAALLLPSAPGAADTVRVDVAPERQTNSIRPTEALGAGVDRLPYGASDKLFTPKTLQRRLAAGHLPAEHRAARGGLALEPARQLERSG